MKRRVGILCALRPEISGLLRAAQTENLRRGTLWRASLKGVPLLLCRCGGGLKRAEGGARALVDEAARGGEGDSGPSLSALFCVGAAGGLDPHLRLGDIVSAKEVLGPGDEPPLEAHPSLLYLAQKAARASGLPLQEGRLLSMPQAVVSPKEKARLFSAYRALAVDMESLGAARVARDARVPFLALRVISDDARMTLPVPAGLSSLRLLMEGGRFLAKAPKLRRALLDLNRLLAEMIARLDILPQELP